MKNLLESPALKPFETPKWIRALITDNQEVALAHYRMRLEVGSFASACRAGQFVHVLPRPANTRDPLLRRAFSIMTVSGKSVDVLYRVMGRGTSLLSQLRVGDTIDVIGPLGKPFGPLPSQAILVGGGVGVPPLVMLASTRIRPAAAIDLPTNKVHNSPVPVSECELSAIIGARSKQDLIGVSELTGMGIPVEVSTDDGSTGHHGRVTDLLEVKLQAPRNDKPTVYSCGPFAMLRAVAKLCEQYNVPCQVSLEENMPCGVGVCNGCVIPVMSSGDEYGRYRRICVDGPVAWAHEIDWDHLSTGAACY